jgi:PBSX family phage portal protein
MSEIDSDAPETSLAKASGTMRAFTFGDPEPVLNQRAAILDMLQSRWNGRWYQPPIPLDGLSRAFHSSPHHSSAILLKRNLLLSTFIPSKILSRREFEGLALDYIALGNGYLEKIGSRIGGTAKLERSLAKYMRVGKDGEFFQVSGWKNEHAFADGSVVHVNQSSLDQEIYGIPEYISALQSAFLNENATLFRRKYYLNGSHAGFILHLDGQFSDEDVELVRDQLKSAKGMGNFRNLLLQSSGGSGSKEPVKLIPISEVAAKDEFLGIKNTTRDDVLAAHRTPPQLIGVVPTNAGGFGDMDKAVAAFVRLEIKPIQMQLLEINQQLGEEAIAFAEEAAPAN